MTFSAEALKSQIHRVELADGFSALVRPIRADDGPRLSEGLRQLSPESRRRRFLGSRGGFTPTELNYFTHCDGVNHLALVVVAIDPQGEEHEFIAVARCMRDGKDESHAEVAITVADNWQHRGVGEMLIIELARNAWEAGIRRWTAVLFVDNGPMRKLLQVVGQREAERIEVPGVARLVYRLSPATFSGGNAVV